MNNILGKKVLDKTNKKYIIAEYLPIYTVDTMEDGRNRYGVEGNRRALGNSLQTIDTTLGSNEEFEFLQSIEEYNSSPEVRLIDDEGDMYETVLKSYGKSGDDILWTIDDTMKKIPAIKHTTDKFKTNIEKNTFTKWEENDIKEVKKSLSC